jgi:hypothetical protein
MELEYWRVTSMSLLWSWIYKGGASPPVSPEVIDILLLQRSCWQMDAPSEHVKARMICDSSGLSSFRQSGSRAKDRWGSIMWWEQVIVIQTVRLPGKGSLRECYVMGAGYRHSDCQAPGQRIVEGVLCDGSRLSSFRLSVSRAKDRWGSVMWCGKVLFPRNKTAKQLDKKVTYVTEC